jgi:hypothetical protein
MQKLKAVGDSDTKTFGLVTITAQRTGVTGQLIHIQVTAGVTPNDILTKTFSNRAEAAAWYQQIRDYASAGLPVHQIEANMIALVEAAMAVECADPDTIKAEPRIARLQNLMPTFTPEMNDLAARINADWDWAKAQRDTEQAALNQDIANILGREIGGLKPDKPGPACNLHPSYPANGCPACRNLPWPKPDKALTDTVPSTGESNSASVADKLCSDPMDRIIAEASTNSGRIERYRDADSRQILALHKRGLATPIRVKHGNTWSITGAQLTNKGFRHAAQQVTA